MSNQLRQSLAKKIPPHLMPGNVGAINRVTWPFWSPLVIDFGMNPTYDQNTRKSASFRVSTEGAFLVRSISRKASSYSDAGELAPLQLRLIDRQSTRQMNDEPIPLQMIGKRSNPTVLPMPFLIAPAAQLEVEISSFLDAPQATQGSGRHEIVLHGYRVRIEDMDQLAAIVYSDR